MDSRVAVVTGASSGIGASLARALAARGWHTVLLARREERLRALANELGGDYEVCDVGDRDAVEAAAARIADRHRAIALLVNNAGIPGRAGFLAADPERIVEVLRVNYLGSVWCLRAFLPGLEAAGRADVVNVVSVAGTVAYPPSGPYGATKHAQLAFSRAVAAELRPRGIRVHTVLPGFVETEGFPQRAVMRNPLLRRLVVDPDLVVRRILGALEHDRRELHVPRWYRAATLAQALAPGLLSRMLEGRGRR
ncbi:MAG: SDR family NAD(P)-dependent oxidoreductase [Actinobacteria bacterium]|nr:SDR family NAD(P)-dependent oxidoreductase [Actinomycetota bacterium]